MPKFLSALKLACILLSVPCFVVGQKKDLNPELSFLFYNVENLFDCDDDSLTSDDEFTPGGTRGWTKSRLYDKLDRLSKVILAAGKWNPPVVVGLCEIENEKVLQMLANNPSLKKYNYKIIHKESPDERGIDVAMLYRADLFRPFDYQNIAVFDSTDRSFKTREILQVSGVLNGCDTLHFFVNHWPSRYGGIMETAKYRTLAAKELKTAIRHSEKKYSQPKIVCMGDFNDQPFDESLMVILDESEGNGKLVNLSSEWQKNEIKTLKNEYSWEIFDQWIVSDSFLKSNSCFRFLNAEIVTFPFLLENDNKFGGVKPKRTYVGFKYQEGFSDHLPILIRLKMINH
ncbi:MAG: endonuclease [Prolixibacteraceae bacterium]|nr:endonuclease [Prolixibacteraceae bacterium]